MSNLHRISVALRFDGKDQKIGELVRDDRTYYFRYTPEYLASGNNISPFKLKWTNEVQQANTAIFNGLFGVFADSLPDGWGRLLLDRALANRSTNLDEVTELDRLTYVGDSGLGALTYHPVNTEAPGNQHVPDLDQLAHEATNILRGEATAVLEELVQLGGSSGGARPKAMVGYNPTTSEIMAGAATLPAGFEHWIIKFPATIDPPDIANIEYAYHRMALTAGLRMSECKLFNGASGRQYFGTRRFDREWNKRLHLHSAAGLFHDNFRATSIDYGNLMYAAFKFSERDVRVYDEVLRLAAFNVLAHNHDDHGKNVSFLMDAKGNWVLAPAYDLTFSRSQHGYQSMSVAGNQQPDKDDILRLAEEFDVPHGQRILEEVQTAISTWPKVASEQGVSKDRRAEIKDAINR